MRDEMPDVVQEAWIGFWGNDKTQVDAGEADSGRAGRVRMGD